MNTKAILERILEDQNLTVRDLANLLGYPESKLYCVKQGKTKTFSKELLELISNRFPNYSRVWLMTGMGDITVTNPSAPVFNNHGDNVQNEQNVISKDFIELIKSTIAQTDRAMNQTDKMIAIAEKAMDSLQAALDQLKKQ